MNREWRVVTIAGVGLIGGSFALAIRKAGFDGKIIGVSSPSTTQAALQRGVIDQALPLADAAAQSDVIYLAQPIERILDTLGVLDTNVRPGTLISHLPQLLSTALASLIDECPGAANVAGPAAKDMTRLALSPYDIWRDIFSTNTAEIDGVLQAAIARLETLRHNLQSRAEMEAAFARAAQAASVLRKS